MPKRTISSHFLVFLTPLGKSRRCRRPPAPPPLRACTKRPFLTKNAISPRKFAGFGNAGSAHPLELFFFSFFFWFFCLTITASERLAFRNARPDLPRFASTGRGSGPTRSTRRGYGPKNACREKAAKDAKVFERSGLVRQSAKIAKLGGAKKVRRSSREAPKTEKRHFDWKFPSGGPEKGDFFPFFGVLHPPKPRPHTKNLQENGVL